MPKTFNEQLRKSHDTFYCVNGHRNVYSKKKDIEEVQGKLMNEFSKNAQLEKVISDLKNKVEELEKSFINRIFKTGHIIKKQG